MEKRNGQAEFNPKICSVLAVARDQRRTDAGIGLSQSVTWSTRR